MAVYGEGKDDLCLSKVWRPESKVGREVSRMRRME